MGALGSVLGGEKEFVPSFFLDFENAAPQPAEQQTYTRVQAIVSKHDDILDLMSRYKGAAPVCARLTSRLHRTDPKSDQSADR